MPSGALGGTADPGHLGSGIAAIGGASGAIESPRRVAECRPDRLEPGSQRIVVLALVARFAGQRAERCPPAIDLGPELCAARRERFRANAEALMGGA